MSASSRTDEQLGISKLTSSQYRTLTFAMLGNTGNYGTWRMIARTNCEAWSSASVVFKLVLRKRWAVQSYPL